MNLQQPEFWRECDGGARGDTRDPYKNDSERPAFKAVKPKRVGVKQTADTRRQKYQTNQRPVEESRAGAVNTRIPDHQRNSARYGYGDDGCEDPEINWMVRFVAGCKRQNGQKDRKDKGPAHHAGKLVHIRFAKQLRGERL